MAVERTTAVAHPSWASSGRNSGSRDSAMATDRAAAAGQAGGPSRPLRHRYRRVEDLPGGGGTAAEPGLLLDRDWKIHSDL